MKDKSQSLASNDDRVNNTETKLSSARLDTYLGKQRARGKCNVEPFVSTRCSDVNVMRFAKLRLYIVGHGQSLGKQNRMGLLIKKAVQRMPLHRSTIKETRNTIGIVPTVLHLTPSSK